MRRLQLRGVGCPIARYEDLSMPARRKLGAGAKEYGTEVFDAWRVSRAA
jgi:hypothetical protein